MSIDRAVELDIREGVARVSLNRPGRFNALDLTLARELHLAILEVGQRSDVGVVVLDGRGAAFCAGGDVVEMARAENRSEFLRELTSAVHAALEALAELDVVTISQVHGTVAGGGLGLMLSGDLIIAAKGTKFVAAYSSVGLSPDCGVSTLLPAAIGVPRALDFMIRGRTLGASEALDWGLVTETVDDGQLAAHVDALAHRIATDAPLALGQTRRLMRAASLKGFSQRLSDESVTISALAGTTVAAEKIDRFVKK